MRIYFSSGIFIIFLMATSCARKTQSVIINNQLMLDSIGITMRGSDLNTNTNPCNKPENYSLDSVIYSLNNTRTIKLIFHIMNSADSSKNFSPEKAPQYFRNMVRNAQERIDENRKMNLPEGNNTAVFPAHYKYQIATVPEDEDRDGFLYHYDDDMYYFINRGRYRNNYKRDVIDKYKVGNDSILNIFAMPHHPDSVASTTYKARSSGIALGNHIKVAGIYENGGESWRYATLLNHEIGHVLGLRHSWIMRDGCDDTPPNDNCYDSHGEAPCNGVTSNNMMDYNNSQMAITPCQLGIIHRNFSNNNSRQRKLLVKDWCNIDTTHTIVITDSIEWKGDRDNRYNIVVESGGSLSLYCRISMPKNSSITVLPGGKLYLYDSYLHNDCGHFWDGIQVNKKGKKKGLVYYSGNVTIENTNPEPFLYSKENHIKY